MAMTRAVASDEPRPDEGAEDVRSASEKVSATGRENDQHRNDQEEQARHAGHHTGQDEQAPAWCRGVSGAGGRQLGGARHGAHGRTSL
jgi:hypothetical protein